jgi:hypothetical protein
MVTVLFVACMALLALGVPVAFALGGGSVAAMVWHRVRVVALAF